MDLLESEILKRNPSDPKVWYMLQRDERNRFKCQVYLDERYYTASAWFLDPKEAMNDAALLVYRWKCGGSLAMKEVVKFGYGAA